MPADAVPEGFDAAYVTVLDESVAEEALALLAHRVSRPLSEGWEAIRLHLRPTEHAGRCEDAEACAFHAGRLYIAGSQYGSKDGPLQPKRAWVASMATKDLARAAAGERPELEIARNPFALHRAVNDALEEAGLDLLPLGEEAREKLVLATVRRGEEKEKRWRDRIRPDDQPVNVEGITFTPDGTLLVGLRYPVRADGDPLVVGLSDADALFEEGADVPECSAVWTLRCEGDPERPVGVRGLHTAADGALHALVGSLDAEGKESVLLADRPAAGTAHCEHWRVDGPLPEGGGEVEATSLHDFPDLKTVEGLAQTPDGHFLYVVDRDHDVHLRFLLVD